MLTYRKHVETTVLKCKEGLSVQKAIAVKSIEQHHLFQLYQSVVLSVTDYRLGLTTKAQINLLKLDRVQNEAMQFIQGTTKDTPIETMRFMLDLPQMQTGQKVEQVKAYSSANENPLNHLNVMITQTDAFKRAIWNLFQQGWVRLSSKCFITIILCAVLLVLVLY